MADERCLQNGGFLGFGKEKRRLAAQLEESRQEAARIKADNERIQADNARIQAEYEAKHASMQGQASQRDADIDMRSQRMSAARNIQEAMKAVKAMLTEQRGVDKIYYAIAEIRTKQCANAVKDVIEQTISEDRLTENEEEQLKELLYDYEIAWKAYNGKRQSWANAINSAHRAIVAKCTDVAPPAPMILEVKEYGPPLTEIYEPDPESVPGLLKIRQVYRDADVQQETAEINAFYLKLRDEIAALAKFSEEGSTATPQEKSIHKMSYAMKVHAYKTLQEGMFSGLGVDLVKNYPSVQRYNRLLQETRHIAIMSGVKPDVPEGVLQPALSIERQASVPPGPSVSQDDTVVQAGGALYEPHAGIGFLQLVGAWTSENVRGEELDKFVPGGWFESLTAKLSGDASDKLSCKNWIAGAIPFFDLWNQLQNARLATDDAGLIAEVTEWTEEPPTAPSVLETPARPLPADPVQRKEFVRQNSMVIGKKSGKNDEGDCDCRLMWDAINAVEKRAGLSLSGPYSELNGRTGPLRDPVKERPEGIMGPTLAALDPYAPDVSNYGGFSQNRYIEIDGEKMRIPDNKKVKKHNGKYVDFMIAGPGERLALKPYDNHLFKTGILYFETDTASKGPRDPRLDRLDPFDEQYIKPRALGVRFPASDLRIQAPPSDRNAPVSIGSDGYDTLGRGDGSLEEPLTPSASVQARIDATQAGLDAEDATSSELGNAGPLPSIEPPARRRFGSFRTRKEREDLNDLRPWKSMGGGAKATYVIGNVALAAVTVAAAFFAAA
jgi:hypothetical protein